MYPRCQNDAVLFEKNSSAVKAANDAKRRHRKP